MYQIENITDGKTYLLHSQKSGNLKVIEPRLSRTLNKTGSLTFRIPSSHTYYQTLKKLSSVIEVLEDGELIFEGRILSDEADFYNTKDVVCEGSMAYLQDSIQRPFSFTGGIKSFLQQMIDRHNEQVEARKQFQLGQVNVADRSNEMTRESTTIISTWNVLKKYLLDIHGGYLWVSYQNGKKVLNYTYDLGGFNEQTIRFGVNLLDLTKYQDASEIVTCLVPYGAEVEYKDELGETQKRTVDIMSVNQGKDYITAEDAVITQHGKIWASYQWPDITDPAKLLQTAKEYLKETSGIPDILKINAVDLNYTGADIRRFQLGKYTTCISKPHNIRKELLLTQLDLYLDDPSKGSISLGSTLENFTGATVNKQVTISKELQNASDELFAEMLQKIQNATTLITGGFGGYVVLDNIDPATGKKMHPWRILVMNTPDKDTAKNVIQINQNGIGFSTTGINGPYRNAWTIDGNLVADFVTTGTMLADRIRGGTLEVGGSGLGKDGVIRVLDAKNNEIMRMDKSGITINAGKLNAPDIVGGTADFGDGLFYADDEEVNIGGFYARYGWGRDIFQSFDGQCGMSAAASGKGKLWFWAGYNSENDYDFLVNNLGEVHCRELYIESNDDYWQGWNLSDTLKDLDSKYHSLSDDIDDLRDQINNIDTGGGTV